MLRVLCSVPAKFGANRDCQEENVHTYPHHHRIHPLLPFYIFFCVFLLLLLLIRIFWETSFLVTFDLTLPLICPFANSAGQDRQTPWWAALEQQAQRRTSGNNSPVQRLGSVKKVGVRYIRDVLFLSFLYMEIPGIYHG